MISLGPTDSIQAGAGTATAVTSTVLGDEATTAGVDSFKILDQRQLATSAASLYSPGAGKVALIKKWLLANTTGSIVNVTLYLNGTLAANQIASFPIPANGEAVLADDGWHVHDANGAIVSTVSLAANAVANSNLAQMGAHTYKGNATGSTATPTDVTATALVADLVANGGLTKGATGWIDVTQVGTYVVNAVLPGNTGATNNTNIAAILTAAPTGSTIYFPGGSYNFASKITVPAKTLTFQGQGSNLSGGYTLLNWNANVGDNLMQLTGGNWYSQFYNLIFTCTVNQTAGAALAIGDNVSCNIYDCTFNGNGATLFNGIDFTGTSSGENTLVSNVNISKYTNIAININAVLTSPVIFATVIQGQWGTTTQCAVAGIQIQNAGAVLIDDCDIIGSVNNLLINPGVGIVVASVYIMNSYFDNSLGSCIKITGAGATVRCRFIACSFTTSVAGANSYSAVEITTTVTAGAQGIDFENCSILNTFATTGTTNGFLITGAADFSIIACRIAGWTNGINITPFNSNGKTQPMIEDNTIGPTAGFGGNSVGILLNAGAVQYGALMIQNNQLVGNTTPLTDNSTIAAATQKIISGNGGLVSGTSATVANFAGVTTTTETVVLSLPIPANSLTTKNVFKYNLAYHPSGAVITQVQIRVGTTGTVSDAALQLMSATAATNGGTRFAAGVAAVQAVGASATFIGAGVEQVGAISAAGVSTAASGSFNSTVANFVTVTVKNTTTATTTVYAGELEIL